eukprot:s443_g30.t1
MRFALGSASQSFSFEAKDNGPTGTNTAMPSIKIQEDQDEPRTPKRCRDTELKQHICQVYCQAIQFCDSNSSLNMEAADPSTSSMYLTVDTEHSNQQKLN